jgi:hypothetical protein
MIADWVCSVGITLVETSSTPVSTLNSNCSYWVGPNVAIEVGPDPTIELTTWRGVPTVCANALLQRAPEGYLLAADPALELPATMAFHGASAFKRSETWDLY